MLSIDTTSSPSASDTDNRVTGGLTPCLGGGRGESGLIVITCDTVARQPASHILHVSTRRVLHCSLYTESAGNFFFQMISDSPE